LAGLGVSLLVVAAAVSAPAAHADSKRLNDGVAQNVYTIQNQAGCTTNLSLNPNYNLRHNGTRTTYSTIEASTATSVPAVPHPKIGPKRRVFATR